MSRERFDVVVIGGGPAGIAAATRAAENGAQTLLVDEGFHPGGQIYRRLPGISPPAPRAAARIERLQKSGAVVRSRTCVTDVFRAGYECFRLTTSSPEGAAAIDARRIVLCTGARELFSPFPGWTLPGVIGAGGLQAMVKSGAEIAGKRVVIAGTGPLLWPVAKTVLAAGAHLVAIVERASRGRLAAFLGALALTAPGKLGEAFASRFAVSGVPLITGSDVRAAHGHGRLSRVEIWSGAKKSIDLECDYAAIGEGLVPNTETAVLLGADVRFGSFHDGSGPGTHVVTEDDQATTVPGVFAAGEIGGVAGVDAAFAEGEIAGIAAAGRIDLLRTEAQDLFRERARARFTATLLSRFFPAPSVAVDSFGRPALLCRCEDVPLDASVLCARSGREAKLLTRAGMGPCQGRICSPARIACGGAPSIDHAQPPTKPAAFADFLVHEER